MSLKSVNYVIATWSGKNTKVDITTQNPAPENTLKFHLEKLSQLRHKLAQITIMKPHCPENIQMPSFYNISQQLIDKLGCHVVFEDCENFGYSNGQWLKAYELYKQQFDYYLLVEDDYVAYQDDFDKLIVKLYQQKFPTGIGKLCGYVQGYPLQVRHKFPLHYESAILVSAKTFEMLYTSNRWNGAPRQALNTLLIENQKLNLMRLRPNSIGGFYQVNFSLLFTLIGIPIRDFSREYIVPYYEKETNTIYHLQHNKTSLECFRDPNCLITSSKTTDPSKYLIVPLQFHFI